MTIRRALAPLVLTLVLSACSSAPEKKEAAAAPPPASGGATCTCAAMMSDCMCDHCTAEAGKTVACDCGAKKKKK